MTIFTPDDTHFPIAMACIEAGLHVLIAKPAVKILVTPIVPRVVNPHAPVSSSMYVV